jgi:hypothetical protein
MAFNLVGLCSCNFLELDLGRRPTCFELRPNCWKFCIYGECIYSSKVTVGSALTYTTMTSNSFSFIILFPCRLALYVLRS